MKFCELIECNMRNIFPEKSYTKCDGEISKCLFHNKLCYGSISVISVNHNARNCKNRKESKVCKKRHPTSLHGYKAEKSKVKQLDGNSSEESKVTVNSATANTKSDVIRTYAMLDNCSQATFMQNKLLGALGLHGRKTSITVKTMNGNDKVI